MGDKSVLAWSRIRAEKRLEKSEFCIHAFMARPDAPYRKNLTEKIPSGPGGI
jgi:hypothetical protein